jgi:hypothetical protein
MNGVFEMLKTNWFLSTCEAVIPFALVYFLRPMRGCQSSTSQVDGTIAFFSFKQTNRSHSVAQAAVQCSCLSLPSAGIMGVYLVVITLRI